MVGFRDVKITNAVIDAADVSVIVDQRNRVVVQDCWIEDLDIATLNEDVIFLGCSFNNSELIAPNLKRKAVDCIFRNYKGDKKFRQPIRLAQVVNGYHTPVCAPKYA